MPNEFQEINEALAQNFATPDDIDEADLEAELDMLEDEFEEIGESESDAVPSYLQETTAMPSIPTGTLGGGEKVPQKVDEYGLPVETWDEQKVLCSPFILRYLTMDCSHEMVDMSSLLVAGATSMYIIS